MSPQYHVILGTLAGLLFVAEPALAQDSQQDLQQQIKALQAQLNSIQKQLAAQQAATRQVQAEVRTVPGVNTVSVPPGSQVVTVAPDGGVRLGAITVKMGGFIEGATIIRSRNETSDVGSSFSTIPFGQVPSGHMSEFHESARQSRLSLLVQGMANPDTNLAAYFEGDFLGVSTIANNGESNSYSPRLRQAYLTVDRSTGWHFEAGQAWSLVTGFKDGLVPRDENIPLTIDAQYVPGFNWRRVPQVRLTKTFSPALSVGVSLEAPEASFGGAQATGITEFVNTTPGLGSGGATLNNGNCFSPTPAGNPNAGAGSNCAKYSIDNAPDFVLKGALDPGWGHYEAFGLARLFQTRAQDLAVVAQQPQNDYAWGGGVGGNFILPVIPKWLDLQSSALWGRGIGQYGAGQFNDVTTDQFGQPKPIEMFQGLTGAVAHPTPNWDVYFYGGYERAFKTTFDNGTFGYGISTGVDNAGCNIENSAAATCTGVNENIWQLTGGFWERFYKGPAGTLNWGVQYSYTQRQLFEGDVAKFGVNQSPTTDDNMVFVSFRYYPFSH
ncbi:MAG: hypothetical protein WA884_07195 [Methyloceanibacter sp.]